MGSDNTFGETNFNPEEMEKHEAPKIPIIEPTLRFIKSEGKKPKLSGPSMVGKLKSKPIQMETKTKEQNPTNFDPEIWFDINGGKYKGIKSRHYAIKMLQDYNNSSWNLIKELDAKITELRKDLKSMTRDRDYYKEKYDSMVRNLPDEEDY